MERRVKVEIHAPRHYTACMENRGRYPVMIVADNPRRLIAGFVREEALLRAGMNGAKKDMSPPLAVEIPGTKKGLLS
ncbi:MAG: hypothetical protein HYU48_02450, partial [Candidatus Levybacteria bacterium]|nr:hypothetical protein [Candidatus Levybacteria bacterium]